MFAFPDNWSRLKYPWQRFELIDSLDELRDPARTARWLDKDPNGPIVGIDETFHFFFDDHDFDAGAIGYSLFDDHEVTLIAGVKNGLQAILETNKDGDDAYFLAHPLWPDVVIAAEAAYSHLARSGTAEWVEP